MHRIEPLEQQDLLVAQQIHGLLQLAHTQEAALLDLDGQTSASQSAEDIQSSRQFYLGAIEGSLLVGATSVGPDEEPEQLSIATLIVHPGYQRRGIGRSLVAEALHRGRGMAFSVSVAAKNVPALALYRELGFIEYRHGTLGPEELAMVKLRRNAP
jgi:ribosomal protein S18 acetylase RimI-like enzyme